jgi:hypothetical protein
LAPQNHRLRHTVIEDVAIRTVEKIGAAVTVSPSFAEDSGNCAVLAVNVDYGTHRSGTQTATARTSATRPRGCDSSALWPSGSRLFSLQGQACGRDDVNGGEPGEDA